MLIEVTAEILENQFNKNNASLPIEETADTFENPLYKNAANLLNEVTAEPLENPLYKNAANLLIEVTVEITIAYSCVLFSLTYYDKLHQVLTASTVFPQHANEGLNFL